MPVGIAEIDGRWRVVEPPGSTTIATNAEGHVIDGGGHDTKAEAEAQASAINAAHAEKHRVRREPTLSRAAPRIPID